MVNNQKGGFLMLRDLLSAYGGRIYVYLDNSDIAKQFFRDAENEGFIFTDGTKPTLKHTSNIIAVNADATINYVGFVGRMAFQAASKIGNQPLHKIDYRDFLKRSE